MLTNHNWKYIDAASSNYCGKGTGPPYDTVTSIIVGNTNEYKLCWVLFWVCWSCFHLLVSLELSPVITESNMSSDANLEDDRFRQNLRIV